MRRIAEYIEGLRTYRIPERYEWTAKIGVRLQDLKFINICDCLHKKYGNQIEPFPLDFDTKLFNKARIRSKTIEYIRIDPSCMIMAQKFLDKEHLLELNSAREAFDAVDLVQCGKYLIVRNGHHRIAINYLKGYHIPARIGIMQ